MRSRLKIIACGLAAVAAAAAPAAAQIHRPLADVLRHGCLQFSVVSGRIVVAGFPYGVISNTTNVAGRIERLSVSGNSGRPSIDYELTTPQGEAFHFQVKHGDGITARHTPPAESAAAPPVTAEYRQATTGPVTLTVGSGSDAQVFRAASLWHLLIDQPEACRQHFGPMLNYLRSDWGLPAKAAEIEQELLNTVGSSNRLERQRWTALVAQLGNDRFATREAADRQLRAIGLAVLPFLQGCETAQLDPEQRFRVRRIIAALTRDNEDDHVVQAASRLSGDPHVWLSLLARPTLATRQIAAGQMAELLGGPIAFNPAAAEDVRKQQIEALRHQLSAGKE